MLRFEFAVVADLTANVLSVCLVVFLTLLPLTGRGGAPAAGPPAAERLFRLTERHPLSGPDMIRLLHARRADPAQRSLDLFADHVELVEGDAPPRRVSAAEVAALPGPAALFVLDPAPYAAVLDALGGGARIAAEMSVPDALRDPADPRGNWSADLRRLDALAHPRARFEAELARILQAAPPRPARGPGEAAGATASPDSLAARLFDRIDAMLDAALNVVLPPAALLGLAFAEIARRRRLAAAVPYGMEASADPL